MRHIAHFAVFIGFYCGLTLGSPRIASATCPGSSDDHPDTKQAARPISTGELQFVNGRLECPQDVDIFRLDVPVESFVIVRFHAVFWYEYQYTCTDSNDRRTCRNRYVKTGDALRLHCTFQDANGGVLEETTTLSPYEQLDPPNPSRTQSDGYCFGGQWRGGEYSLDTLDRVSPGSYYLTVANGRGVTSSQRRYRFFAVVTPVESTPTPDVSPTRGDRRATLLNLSPWQAWVHLYCQKERHAPDAAPCRVTFACNGMSGEPVTWTVDVTPQTIFSYWPEKTAPNGSSADLQAALMEAGKTEAEARRRTTCEVFSLDPLAVRGYTRFGNDTLIPVAVY